ncbi:MAG: CDGSH iron-sulfur domain-containing protein [Kofleriaceae bacterium]
MSVRIRPKARGPLAVELAGPCELYGLDGNLIDLEGRTRVLLCRCGHTASAPICDGSHNRTDFEKPPARDDEAEA